MIYFPFPLPFANMQNKKTQVFGEMVNGGSESEGCLKKGSTKSALMTFNSRNTVEDNDARQVCERASVQVA